jgi:hypothetical protein
MFKWMQSRRRRLAEDSVPDPNEADRDSGEESTPRMRSSPAKSRHLE